MIRLKSLVRGGKPMPATADAFGWASLLFGLAGFWQVLQGNPTGGLCAALGGGLFAVLGLRAETAEDVGMPAAGGCACIMTFFAWAVVYVTAPGAEPTPAAAPTAPAATAPSYIRKAA